MGKTEPSAALKIVHATGKFNAGPDSPIASEDKAFDFGRYTR